MCTKASATQHLLRARASLSQSRNSQPSHSSQEHRHLTSKAKFESKQDFLEEQQIGLTIYCIQVFLLSRDFFATIRYK